MSYIFFHLYRRLFSVFFAHVFLSDISGNVRALHYALNHPLVFHDSQVRLDQKQKAYNSLTRVRSAKSFQAMYSRLSHVSAPAVETRRAAQTYS
jgi:hypothetical protein